MKFEYADGTPAADWDDEFTITGQDVAEMADPAAFRAWALGPVGDLQWVALRHDTRSGPRPMQVRYIRAETSEVITVEDVSVGLPDSEPPEWLIRSDRVDVNEILDRRNIRQGRGFWLTVETNEHARRLLAALLDAEGTTP